jgi:hypothetical protein
VVSRRRKPACVDAATRDRRSVRPDTRPFGCAPSSTSPPPAAGRPAPGTFVRFPRRSLDARSPIAYRARSSTEREHRAVLDTDGHWTEVGPVPAKGSERSRSRVGQTRWSLRGTGLTTAERAVRGGGHPRATERNATATVVGVRRWRATQGWFGGLRTCTTRSVRYGATDPRPRYRTDTSVRCDRNVSSPVASATDIERSDTGSPSARADGPFDTPDGGARCRRGSSSRWRALPRW